MSHSRTIRILVLVAALVLAATPVLARPAGTCPQDSADDRCERWATVHDDDTIQPPSRSDQFPTSVVATGDLVITTMKNVALDPANPYEATGQWLVTAHDQSSGELVWEAGRNSRVYDSPHAAVISPDGTTLYVTGAAYDAFSVAASDSRIVTVAYEVATGRELWERTWDGLPDGTDVGKVIAISPDGRTVVVGGVTTSPEQDLDFVTIAYDTRRGRQMWTAIEPGIRTDGTDVLNDLVIAPDSRTIYVTGTTAGVEQYDADFVTIAYHRRSGRTIWATRHDGLGQGGSNRANAMAVSPDGSRVVVTGDSFAGYIDGRVQYDFATVAYDTADGTTAWVARYGGPTVGFNAPIAVAATTDAVVVTGQSPGSGDGEGRDYATVAYELADGTQRWVNRYAPPRSNDIALHLAASDTTAHVTGTSTRTIPYTDLDETATVAYDIGTGGLDWVSRVDGGLGDALSPRAITVTPDGDPVVATYTKRSANPLEGQSADVHDAIIVAY